MRFVCAALLLCAACKKPPPLSVLPDGGPAVTVCERNIRAQVTITIAAADSQEVQAACEAAFAEVERMDDVLSDWRITSQLGKLNAQSGKGPLPVSPEMFELLTTAKMLSEETGGAFDVTFASLWGLWSFKADAPRMPTAEELAAKLPLIGYQALKLDRAKQTAEIAREGTRVGLGALGDGYASKRASQVLAAKGFSNHLILIAGDGDARGARHDRPWRVGIRDPSSGGIWATLELKDESVATSGNYQKYFMKDGVRYHHILDPKTGLPARGTSSVTVVAKDGLMADGWATAMFVLGPKKGLPVAQKHGLEVLWFDEAFEVSGTPGMLARVQRVVP